MLKNYFKIAWRNLWRNRSYTLLHILGIGIGMLCCLFIYLYISYHHSFDNYHAHAERTYRLVHELRLETTEYEKGAPYAIYEALQSGVPGVEKTAFLMSDQEFTVRIGGQLYNTGKHAALASAEWFELFDYRWLKGTPKQLDEPNTVVLTATAAEKYFGREDPMGKTILIESKHPFKVVGVIDDSRTNTSLKSDIYLSLASLRTLSPDIWDGFFTSWNFINSTNNVFVSLGATTEKTSVERNLEQLAREHMDPSIADYYVFKLLPLTDLHFDTRYGGTVQKTFLYMLTLIGVCIMIVAGINYVNMSVAQQARRSMEIGARKVFGGSRLQLLAQFMIESTWITFMALAFALIVMCLLTPLINQYLLVKEPIQVVSWTGFWLFVTGLWIIVSFASGIYPAYFLARLNLFEALKNKVSIRNRFAQWSLVVVQNVVAKVMIIATIVIVLQVRFLKNTDMGFDRESVVMLSLPEQTSEQKEVIENYLRKDPHVLSHTFCLQAPASERNRGGTVLFDDRSEWEKWAARYVFADTSYLNTFDIKLLAGRNIRRAKAGTPEYLVNEKMVSLLGFSHPDEILGKTLLAGGMNDKEKGIIVGVVRDFNTKSLLEPIQPTVIGDIPEFQTSIALKLSGSDMEGALADLQQQWEYLFPNEIFDYRFLDQQIEALYGKEILQQKLIGIAGIIAVLICSLGLLGMVSLMTFQRTKEIGIRKVLGASVSGIVALLSKDFIKLVLIAIVIATPIAWYAMNNWLQDFAYRIELQWWMFALAGLLAIFIALLTVSFQSVKAALANPVKSLRSE